MSNNTLDSQAKEFFDNLFAHPACISIHDHAWISPAIIEIVDYDFICKVFDESGTDRKSFGDVKPQELCYAVIRNFMQALIDARKYKIDDRAVRLTT